MAIENAPADVVEHAEAAIAKIDETNAKRKEKNAEKPSKKAEENAPLVEEAFVVLGTETKTASDVAAAMGVSTPKATYLLKTLVAEGRATVEDIKVPKKGTVKAYTAVAVEA
jgi:Fic family protein